MDQPLVSVMLPTYNQVDFVSEALSSAVDQDYEPLEVVVADDGSTDGTVDVILDYARRHPGRVVPLVGLPHLGITGNCNRAVAACRGKYIAFHAGDDVMLPGKISRQVAWLEEDERRVVCYHDVEVIEGRTGRLLHLWSTIVPLRGGVGASGAIVDGNPFCGPSPMVRATAIPAFRHDIRLPLVSDWKFWIDCTASGEFGYIDGVYARYRRWEGNTSTLKDEEVFRDLLTVLSLTESERPELGEACRRRRARVFLGRGLTLLNRGQKAAARGMFRDSFRTRRDWRPVALLGVSVLPGALISLLRRARRVVTPRPRLT